MEMLLMRRIILLIAIVCVLLTASISYAEEIETENTRSSDEVQRSFWDSFGGLFAFTDRPASDVVDTNEVRVIDGEEQWHGPFLYEQGASTAGSECQVGDLIHVYTTDEQGNYKQDIWQEVYRKESSDDVVELNNPEYGAWVHDFMVGQTGLFTDKAYYGYTCYKPNPEYDRVYADSGRCVDSTTYCENPYQAGGSGSYQCDVKDQRSCASCEDGECLTQEEVDAQQPEQTTQELSVDLYDIRVNDKDTDTVVQGENYEVTGVIDVQGECDDCVVETGIDLYGEQFSVIGRSGACGDELTVGAKFSANDETVQFKLIDKAEQKEPGRYRVDVLVYSGCADEGGRELSRETFTVTIETPPEEQKIECYYCDGGRKKQSGPVVAESCTAWASQKSDISDAVSDINQISCATGVECWSDCDAGQTVSRNFDGDSCPDGWNQNKPSCDVDTVDCYQCQNGSLVKEQRSECTGDWNSQPQQCEQSTELTCWECVDGEAVDSVVQDSSCPAGKQSSEPDCDVQTNQCYWCYEYEVNSGYFEQSCSDIGLKSSEPDCSPSNPVTCYTCDVQNNVDTKEWQDTCPSGWFEDKPVCGEQQVCYWCDSATGEMKSDTFAECPTGTKPNEVQCGDVEKVDCANNPNAESCQVQQCQQDSDEPFCDVICCSVDGEAKWEYSGLCQNAVAKQQCTEGTTTNDFLVPGLVIAGVLVGFGVVIYLTNRKK